MNTRKIAIESALGLSMSLALLGTEAALAAPALPLPPGALAIAQPSTALSYPAASAIAQPSTASSYPAASAVAQPSTTSSSLTAQTTPTS